MIGIIFIYVGQLRSLFSIFTLKHRCVFSILPPDKSVCSVLFIREPSPSNRTNNKCDKRYIGARILALPQLGFNKRMSVSDKISCAPIHQFPATLSHTHIEHIQHTYIYIYTYMPYIHCISINRHAIAGVYASFCDRYLDPLAEMSASSSVTARARATAGPEAPIPTYRSAPVHWERPSLFAIDRYLLGIVNASAHDVHKRNTRTRGNRPSSEHARNRGTA